MAETPSVSNAAQGCENARKNSFLNYKLDRLGRSLQHLTQLIGELETHGTALVASSQAIDTSESNPVGRLQMHVLAAVAEFERSVIVERINAGLAAAHETRSQTWSSADARSTCQRSCEAEQKGNVWTEDRSKIEHCSWLGFRHCKEGEERQ